MNDLTHQLDKADRLANIAQKVGFTLWQLQELEGVSAQYFVLLGQALHGMGLEKGMALVERAQRKTFGATINRLRKKELISDDIAKRFDELLSERNWLVHHSKADNRDAVHSDQAMQRLTVRLDNVAESALSLLKEVGSLTEGHVKKYGVSDASIDKMTSEILDQWHQPEST